MFTLGYIKKGQPERPWGRRVSHSQCYVTAGDSQEGAVEMAALLERLTAGRWDGPTTFEPCSSPAENFLLKLSLRFSCVPVMIYLIKGYLIY
jgi:hypothetical protein